MTFPTHTFTDYQGVIQAEWLNAVDDFCSTSAPSLSLEDYTALRAYTGVMDKVYITGLPGLEKPAGISGIFQVDNTDTTSTDNGGTVIVGADGRRWKRDYTGNLNVTWFGAVGDGTVDDTAAFLAGITEARSRGLKLDISDCKLFLVSQTTSIDLDGVEIIGNGKPGLPPLDIPYLNGADNAVANWSLIKEFSGSAIFSRYDGPVFIGKRFSVKNIAIVCDYNKSNSTAFTQSVPATYPGWSQALINTDVAIFFTGSHGIHLKGGLEICDVRNITIAACGGNALCISTTAGVNCPIEYLNFDSSCIFIYSKLANVFLDGFRRHVRFSGCLLNGAGQYDIKRAANPSFSVPDQPSIISCIEVAALPPGIYGGVNHSGSDQLYVVSCYAEVAQSILSTSGAGINYVTVEDNHLIPFDNSWPSNILSVKNEVYRLRTSGNDDITGAFKLYLSSSAAAAAADFFIEEGTIANGVTFTGYKPKDQKLAPPPSWGLSSGTLGNGDAGTYTFQVPEHSVPPINTAPPSSLWAITAAFQGDQLDSAETVLIAVSRLSSTNYVAQVLIQPASSARFSAAPYISTSGLLSIPLTQYTRCTVARIDNQAIRIY